MSKKENAEKKDFSTEKLTDLAKDLYLANLGVYGKSGDLLKDRPSTDELFKDLVKRGEEVQKSAEKRLKETEDRIKNIEVVKDMKLEDRINELKDKFSSLKEKLSVNKAEDKADEVAEVVKKAPAKKAKAKSKVAEKAAA